MSRSPYAESRCQWEETREDRSDLTPVPWKYQRRTVSMQQIPLLCLEMGRQHRAIDPGTCKMLAKGSLERNESHAASVEEVSKGIILLL